jgi:HAD superfamily hydrolase (TIGR01509 family)
VICSIRAVLLDFGDTLFARSRGHLAIVAAAARLGQVVDEPRAAALWEHIQRQALTEAELRKGRDTSPERHRQCWLGLYQPAEELVAGLAEALYEMEISPAEWAPFPDTIPTVRALARAGLRLGIISDTGWDIRPVFRRFGLDDLIGTYVLSAEVGVAKPAPMLFERACDALSVGPAEAIMIGDNASTDGGAINAGIATYLLPPVGPGRLRGLGAVVEMIAEVRSRGNESVFEGVVATPTRW